MGEESSRRDVIHGMVSSLREPTMQLATALRLTDLSKNEDAEIDEYAGRLRRSSASANGAIPAGRLVAEVVATGGASSQSTTRNGADRVDHAQRDGGQSV